MMRSLCIYCASSSDVDERYKVLAANVGRFCGENGVKVIYGGSHVGLMGAMADAALAAGGRVTGVIPEFLSKFEVAHKGLDELYVTQTMQERQALMAELADAFLVLPGGLGTLAEFFEVITWQSLNIHDKPIGVLNFEGFWDPLIEMLARGRAEKFVREDLEAYFDVIQDFEAFQTWALDFIKG